MSKHGTGLPAVGTRVYFSGDMANRETGGEVIGFHPATNYTPTSVDIVWDESRYDGDVKQHSLRITAAMFAEPFAIRRFWIEAEYRAHRQVLIEDMITRTRLVEGHANG